MNQLLKLTIILALLAWPLTASTTPSYFQDIIVTGTDGVWSDSRSYVNLTAAIAALGSDERNLYIAENESVTTLIIPSTLKLHFLNEGAITTTGTLTINTKSIEAGDRQIFYGTGSVDFAPGSRARSTWFSDLREAIIETYDDEMTLVVAESEWVTAGVNVGNDITLEFEAPGNEITVATGVVLGGVKNVLAGDFVCFRGAGRVNFSNEARIKSSWFNRFEYGIRHIDDSAVTLEVSESDVVYNTTTIHANTTLDFRAGVALSDGGGIANLVINGGVLADRSQQLFNWTGAGLVTVGYNVQSHPEWWGNSSSAFWVSPDAVDHGVVSTGGNLTVKDAVDAAGTRNVDIIFSNVGSSDTTPYVFSTNETLPLNITPIFQPGAFISIGNGITVTINRQPDAGLRRIFTLNGTGVVAFDSGYVYRVYPQWWGAVSDGSTDDAVPLQDCIDAVVAITGPRPIIKLVGDYSYGTGLYVSNTALITGITIEGVVGGKAGSGTPDSMTTLVYTGTGTAFQFGITDTVPNQFWVKQGRLANIIFEGNSNTDIGLEVACGHCVFDGVYVEDFDKVGAVGIQATGEANIWRNCSSSQNYDNFRSIRGTNASSSNNLNSFYSCVFNGATRYGFWDDTARAPTYYSCNFQGNGAEGYYHEDARVATQFYGGWLEGNNVTVANGYQMKIVGISSANKAAHTKVFGTVFNDAGANTDGSLYLQSTDWSDIRPCFAGGAPAVEHFVNGGANTALQMYGTTSVSGGEGGPRLNPATRTVAGTRGYFIVDDADFSMGDTWGFLEGFRSIPHETGTAYEAWTSDITIASGAVTEVFKITLSNDYASVYFIFRYTGQHFGGTKTLRLRYERHLKTIAGVASSATVGIADDLDCTTCTNPTVSIIDKGSNVVHVGVDNGEAAAFYGHATLEVHGGARNSVSGTVDRGFTVEQL